MVAEQSFSGMVAGMALIWTGLGQKETLDIRRAPVYDFSKADMHRLSHGAQSIL